MEFEYFKEIPKVEKEPEKETYDGLEIIIEIGASGLELKPELPDPNEAEPGLYVFDKKYFINKSEQHEEKQEENLAEMLEPRLP